MTHAISKRRFSSRGYLRAAMAAGLCCGFVALPMSADAQIRDDIAEQGPDQIEDRLSPGNIEDRLPGPGQGDQLDGIDNIERRFQSRFQEAFNGQRGAERDFSRPYYRDADGRFFSVDPLGRRAYVDGQPQMRNAQRPQLGVMIAGTPEGVRVDQVQNESVAAQAGLQPGDVILSVNGQQLSSPPELQRMVNSMSPGESAEITVQRNGEEQTLTANFPQAQQDQLGQQGQQQGYEVAKPAVEGSNLEQEVQQLRQEVESLRRQLQQLRSQGAGEQPIGDPGQPAPPQPTDASAPQRDGANASPEGFDVSESEAGEAVEGEQPATRATSNEKAELSAPAESAGEASAELELQTEAEPQTENDDS